MPFSGGSMKVAARADGDRLASHGSSLRHMATTTSAEPSLPARFSVMQ
jgi:hypothetical protein